MAERKSFLIRVDRELLDAVQRWANDDLRSLNAQIEFLLRRALADAGRAPRAARHHHGTGGQEDSRPSDGPEHSARAIVKQFPDDSHEQS